MLSTLFQSWRYAARQRKPRIPKSRKVHEPSRKYALRSPVRHLRQNRQRPRPVRGRVRRARAEPAGHAPQVRRIPKTWAQAISPNGTKTSLGLGSYAVVTLAMAREKALANARAIAEGHDPRRRMQKVPTFAQANETVVAIHARHWKSGRTEGQWRARCHRSGRRCAAPRISTGQSWRRARLPLEPGARQWCWRPSSRRRPAGCVR